MNVRLSLVRREESLRTNMPASITYTLPAMQLICNLVAPETPGIEVAYSSTTVTPRPQHEAKTLPEGYVAYPDIGLAYKFHDRELEWIQASTVCIREGGKLAVIDTPKKMQYLSRQVPSSWMYAGIIRVDGTWVNVNTGVPVPLITWKSGWTVGNGQDCLYLHAGHDGLSSYVCSDIEEFVCEIPIPGNAGLITY